MTRFRYLAVFMLTFLLFLTTATAVTCDYEEKAKLNSEAANVKGNYEIKERVLNQGEFNLPDDLVGLSEEEKENFQQKVDYFQVNILNLTEDLYVVVSSDKYGSKTYYYSDTTDGNISFKQEDKSELVTYTVKIYSSSKTGCSGSLLKTLYIPLPRYNPHSSSGVCADMQDYSLCQKYVTFESADYNSEITSLNKEYEKVSVEKENANKNSKWYDNVWNFVKEHKTIMITGGVILVGAAGAVIYVKIRRRRRDVL